MKRHNLEVKAHCHDMDCGYAWHGKDEVKGIARDHANQTGHLVTISVAHSYCYTPPKKKRKRKGR